MSERQDDTTQPGERDAPPEPERAPRNYYYDDGTGYEVYDPAQDEDDETDEGDEAAIADPGGERRTHARPSVKAGRQLSGFDEYRAQ